MKECPFQGQLDALHQVQQQVDALHRVLEHNDYNLMQCIGFVYKHTGIQCTTSGLTKKYEKTAMKRVLLQNTHRLTITYFSYILVSSNIILTYKLVSHMVVSEVKKFPPSN